MLDFVTLVAGLTVLIGSAWLLVRAAARLAVLFGLSRVLVGATVVAFGTSAPELVVNVRAAMAGADGLAMGNIIGSNVANVGLVLGIGAVMTPLVVHSRLVRWEIPVAAAATALTLLVAADGRIERYEGALLFAALIAFIVLSLRLWPEGVAALEEAEEALSRPPGSKLHEAQQAVAGLAGLVLGAELVVRGARGLADDFGISEVAVGILVLAVGTSLPEIATSVVAAVRREHEIAVANVAGSNIFNLLGVLGLTTLFAPVDIDRDLYRFEMPALAASAVLLLLVAWPRGEIRRREGATLLGLYALFVVGAVIAN
jgi:cation:H+ antiporter